MKLWIGIYDGQDGIQIRPYFQDEPPSDKRTIADFGWDGRIEIRGPFDVPCRVVLEMAYDDYSPLSQGTPSRVESVMCASDDEARAVAERLQEHVDQRYQEHSDLWFIYRETSPSTAEPAAAVKLIDEMMEHYLRDDGVAC